MNLILQKPLSKNRNSELFFLASIYTLLIKEKGCWTLKRRILSKKDWWRWKKTPYLLKLLIKNTSPDISILLSNNFKSLVFSLKTLYSHEGLCQHEDKWYWTYSRIKTLDEFWFLNFFLLGPFLTQLPKEVIQ